MKRKLWLLMIPALLMGATESRGEKISITVYGRGTEVTTNDITGITVTKFCPVTATEVCASITITGIKTGDLTGSPTVVRMPNGGKLEGVLTSYSTITQEHGNQYSAPAGSITVETRK